ncbi:hypothetical protein LCGC14_0145290 [marine sediment metagenome]|uniref:Uncharacterized protein n=1 Tax=marine sediment metagenome TaxID=412755 RepID=A0A0F9UZR6_9ZZZZ
MNQKVTMQAKCINGHKFEVDIKQAERDGVVMCPECFNPATVERAEVTSKFKVK